MSKVLHWLYHNRRINIAIVILLTILYPILHNDASKPFYWMVKKLGHDAFHQYLNLFYLIILGFILFQIIKKINNHDDKINIIKYGSFTLLCIFVAYMTLMPYRSEGMHFIQYGILGILVLPLSPNLFFAITLSTLIGYIDEYYQYFVFKRFYLDFNDLMLNVFASANGVILGYIYFNKELFKDQSFKLKSVLIMPYIGILLLALFIVIGLLIGKFSIFKETGAYPLFRIDPENFNPSFWYHTGFGNDWHQIRPISGLILMCAIPLIYLGFDKQRIHEK